MKKILILLILLLSIPLMGQQEINQALEHDGLTRTFIEYVPARMGSSLLLLLHGHGGNAFDMLHGFGFIEKAESTGTIMVSVDGSPAHDSSWPEGTRSWNASNCCGAAVENQVDDVGFISILIGYLKIKYEIKNIYIVGFSNGGMMGHLLISMISGIQGLADISGCGGPYPAPVSEVDIVMAHGVKDVVVPFDEEIVPNNDGRYDQPFWETIRRYREAFNYWPRPDEWKSRVSLCRRHVFYNSKKSHGLLAIIFPEGGHECPAWPFVLNSIFKFWKLEEVD